MHDLKNIKSIFFPFYLKYVKRPFYFKIFHSILKYVKRRLFEVTEELPAPSWFIVQFHLIPLNPVSRSSIYGDRDFPVW